MIGQLVAKNPEKGAEMLFQAAETSKSPVLQVYAARAAQFRQDHKAALAWYEKAAQQKFAEAYLRMGQIYGEGAGVEKDAAKAFELIQKAALEEHSEAQLLLKDLYTRGLGVEKDETKATYWEEKARGHRERGETADKAWAERHRSLAERGDAYAMWVIGDLHAQGNGVEKDMGLAFSWYLKSAEADYAPAYFAVGRCYQFGWGTPANAEKAVEWFKRAASAGNKAAERELNKIQQKQESVAPPDTDF
jgi:TPR repeat protein